MSKLDIVNEIHKPARRNFPRRRVIVKAIDDIWHADLAEFTTYSRYNKGFKYILVVIDCFSKYLWTQPLKNKNAISVRNAMKKILQMSRKPHNLQTDAGKEFYNVHFRKLMKLYKINHYSTFSTKKAVMLRELLGRSRINYIKSSVCEVSIIG